MIKSYLKEYKESLTEEKSILLMKQIEIKKQLAESTAWMENLKKTQEEPINFLYPLHEREDVFEKIEQLQLEQQSLFQQYEDLKKQIQILNAKIDELDSVIIYVKNEDKARKDVFNTMLSNDELLKIKILETQELERQRIARELHDSSVQNLTSMVHKIELCMKLMDIDPIRSKLELSSILKIIKEIIEEMRQMIYDLRPMSFDDMGFEVTLERELSKIQSSGINVGYSLEGEKTNLNPIVALTLLRVIQEACNNAVKHAHASMISVKIKYLESKVIVVVEDNGIGFNIKEKNIDIEHTYSGFGLSTMRERVSLLSGKFEMESKIGTGTKIRMEIPIIMEEE